MCEYCQNEKLLFRQGDDNFDHLYIEIKNSKISIDERIEGMIGTEDNFPINYCPICGRKLNK